MACVRIETMDAVHNDFLKALHRIVQRDRVVVHRPDLIGASVLLAFVDRETEPHLVFTKRTMTVAKHKGQVSLPGGAKEAADADSVDTALREANEEIGLHPQFVEVVGLLDDSITTTGFAITPVVGLVSPKAVFEADPVEVDEVFEVPLSTLLKPSNHMMQVGEHNGVRYQDHRYFAGRFVIWGATGRILNSFLTAYREVELKP